MTKKIVMKSNSLRVGNYVNDPVLGIVQLCQVGDTCRIDNKEKTPRNVEELDVVKLNKEWLLKFGFTYIDEDNEYLSFLVFEGIRFNSDYSDDFSMVTFRIKCKEFTFQFVHQLQNLYYALTGEELTIKNK